TDAAKPPAGSETNAEKPVFSDTITTSASKLSEGLVYSVDRTPERIFDAARGVEVITRDDIQRKGRMTEIADILIEEVGFYKTSGNAGGATAIVRGLSSRQILVMIDGVKINEATWRPSSDTKEQFNLVDPNEIERIEIVRGTVSVLGTEALGAVVNI